MAVNASLVSDITPDVSLRGIYRPMNQCVKFSRSGKQIERIAELSEFFPVLLIQHDSQLLITSSPKYRRHFLDIGLFHVEHQYLEIWQQYKRALLQRNVCLRIRGQDPEIWNPVLDRHAGNLHRMRTIYIDELSVFVADMMKSLLPEQAEGLEMDYRPGWNTTAPFTETLERQIERDRGLGFTRDGPHRADINFKMYGRPVKEVMSRGQIKLFTIAVFLAQTLLFKDKKNDELLILIDDIASELDNQALHQLLEVMIVQGRQTLVTNQTIPEREWNQIKMFHVEQGCVQTVGL